MHTARQSANDSLWGIFAATALLVAAYSGSVLGDEIKVVLTDVMMPYMDGPATIRALHKMNPNVRIIASSGLTKNADALEASNAGVKIFLSKPYTAGRLLEALGEILDQR